MSPEISIIIVNYNGREYLPACLLSLENLDYLQNKYEVIIVDNASEDDSVQYITKNFPGVKLIESSSNIGFAAGNNLGLRKAQGKYLALLNNDTSVDASWLTELVKTIESDPKIGICTSKLLFYYKFIELKLLSSFINKKPIKANLNNQPNILKISKVKINDIDITEDTHFLNGFSPPLIENGKKIYLAANEARLRIPVLEKNNPAKLSLTIASLIGSNKINLDIESNQNKLAKLILADELNEASININPDLNNSSIDVINNAGGIIFSDGSGADRGFLEEDKGQYEKVEEVFGACGASMLLRRKVLEQIGDIDDYFFTYYEDTDFSWRTRLNGWKIVYVPKSIVRHIHCGTTID